MTEANYRCVLHVAQDSREVQDSLVVELATQCGGLFEKGVKMRGLLGALREVEYINSHTARLWISEACRADLDPDSIEMICCGVAEALGLHPGEFRVSIHGSGTRDSRRILAQAKSLVSV